MIRRRLGRSGLEVGVVAFGCMSLGEDHAANARLIHAALDLGIDLFDTADLYRRGQNEETLGRALQGRRHSAIIATKVGNQWRADGSGWDWNPRKSYIKESVQGSLGRLRTDVIDLYQLHGGTIDDPMDGPSRRSRSCGRPGPSATTGSPRSVPTSSTSGSDGHG
jgi:aryl-alcohol dehydrogenase-like predicted oxidoreductase